jgi:hypothetical protein
MVRDGKRGYLPKAFWIQKGWDQWRPEGIV